MTTASGLARMEACPASATLAGAAYSGPAAEQGTENHRVIEEIINAGGVPDELEDLFSGAEQVHTEVAYVIDTVARVARRLGKLPSARDYGKLGATEIGMTLDVEIVHADRVTVIDWKSRKRVTPAERNLQIAAQMCAVESHYGLPGSAGLVYLDNMERDLAPFSLLDSGARWTRLARILERAGTGEPRMSSECTYCPALVTCPAHKRTLASMMDGDLAAEVGAWPVERVADAWEKLKAVEDMAERVRAAIQMRARHEPIPLNNGRRLKLVESSRSSMDAKAMAARLEELGEDTSKYKRTTYFDKVTEGK